MNQMADCCSDGNFLTGKYFMQIIIKLSIYSSLLLPVSLQQQQKVCS